MFRVYGLIFFLILFIYPSLYAYNQDITNDTIRAERLRVQGIRLARQNLFMESIDSLILSLEINKRLFGEESSEAVRIKNPLGINYKNIGQPDKALKVLKEAESYYLVHDTNSENLAIVYNSIGTVYESKLDYINALDFLQRSINIFENQKDIDKIRIGSVSINIADIYRKIQNYDKALEIIDEYYSVVDKYDKLIFLELRAMINHSLENYMIAEKSYQETIKMASELYSNNDIYVAFELLNYANFLTDTKRLGEANGVLERAYKIIILTQPEIGLELADYYFYKGNIYAEQIVQSNEIKIFKRQKSSNLRYAIDYSKRALSALNVNVENLKDSTIDLSSSLSFQRGLDFLKQIADTYVQLAEIYKEEDNKIYFNNLTYAIDYYSITSSLIQKSRKEISSEESKLQLTALEQETFQKMIDAAYKVYETNSNPDILNFAFKNAERIKASAVFDRLSEEFAKNNLIPQSYLDQEKMLNSSITSLQEELNYLESANEHVADEIQSLKNKLLELKRDRDLLNQELESKYPNYYNLKYSDNLLGIHDIQKKLKPNEVLIEYVINENDSIPKLYSFLISKEKIDFVQPSINRKFIDAVQNTFSFMSNSRHMFTKNQDSKEFALSSYALYEKLILPFKNEIRDKKLIIIPDGKLNYIAFDALIEELPDTSATINFRDLKYMIKSNTINYSYSANLLYLFKKSKASLSNEILAFAPHYSTTDSIELNNQKMALIPLEGIKEEVELIASKMKKVTKFTDEYATEINFREQSEKFDILHLAMHAIIDDSDPAYSRLAFTQNNNENESIENNGWLNTADIYNLDLNARLTVLSACNTGGGTLRKGEGVMSLARGFLYAGCPSIVMSLWEVDDKAGTEIMGSFYKNLKRGRSIDESIRLAKLNYLENANPRTAHPHYWLGYVSIGDNSPLYKSYDYYFFGLLMIALIIVTFDQLIRAGKFRKKQETKE